MARNHDAQPNASNPVPRSYTAADNTEAVQSDATRVYTAADWMITIVPASDARQKPLVKTFYNNAEILSFEANLRRGLDVEMLTRNSGTRAPEVDWHSVFTAISNKLPTQDQDAWQVAIDSLDTFQPERKDYLWYPFIPKGEPTSLDGDPGAGKSALVIKIIAHCTTGTPFPTLFDDKSEQPFDPQPVLLLTYEDDPASTILPRVVINGGNPKLVQIVKGKKNAKGDLLPITMQEIDLLGQAIQDYRPALVVFDPIQSFLGQGVDMNHASETRPLLDAVRNLCKEHGCTPLYVRHNGKSQHTKALHAALGSIDITANMRSAMSLFHNGPLKS